MSKGYQSSEFTAHFLVNFPFCLLQCQKTGVKAPIFYHF